MSFLAFEKNAEFFLNPSIFGNEKNMMFKLINQPVTVVNITKTFEIQPNLQIYIEVLVRNNENFSYQELNVYPTSRFWPFLDSYSITHNVAPVM